ncbi:MAG: hypothetical protein EPO23_03335 [Xanthobacteraceae bacterium]|nr:MAG: hypothetical protein EPO23_03335 [Xanthobacteraceae bacterium]
MRELIVDSFAGGGGASTGIERALGLSPDIAINHDATALAMHAANHPSTLHLPHNIWKVDPLAVCDGRPVGLLWASPDCKHFSKAKGGKPVEKSIRDLAWVVVRWARQVRPRVIILENVEEFSTWGPLADDGRPCPARKGQTFKRWTGELRRLGYRVEWRELRACDFGAPTIRKRLFLIARRDGAPIIWPVPTHGDPKSEAVKSGALKPWRTAAEIIDWSLPCYSIFLTPEEARVVGVKRPLAEATMARIAKGVKRYVLEADEPFIVNLTHHGAERCEALDEPIKTVTGAHRGEKALVMPVMSYGQQGGASRAADDPLHTITASRKDQNQVITAQVAPFVTGCGGRMGQTEPRGADRPAQTLTAKADAILVTPTLIQTGYGERVGQEPRVPGLDKPLGTVVAGGVKHAVVAPHLMTMRNAQKPFNEADKPTHTITSGGAHLHLVSAFLAQHNLGVVGHGADEPVSTITQTGSQQAVVSAGLINQKGSDQRSAEVKAPTPTQTAQGWYLGEVRAFLMKYYGTGEGQDVAEPAHTVTTKERFGLVTIHGEPYQIVDIGMRMLTPRELFRAQGFPETYIIDRARAYSDGMTVYAADEPISKTDQVRMCGNSVCPDLAEALVRANFAPREVVPIPADEFSLEAAE